MFMLENTLKKLLKLRPLNPVTKRSLKYNSTEKNIHHKLPDSVDP